MGDMAGGSLGEVQVEVRAGLAQLERDFAHGRQMSEKFAQDIKKKPIEIVSIDNRYARKLEDAQIKAAEFQKQMQKRALANAAAINAVTRAINPAVASTRMLSSAVRDVEKAYMSGAISAKALARANTLAAESGILASRSIGPASHLGREFLQTARSARFLISAIGVGFAAAAARGISSVIDTTAAISDMAKEFGLTTTQLQEYRLIAKDVGMTTDEMDGAFKEFRQTVKNAAGGNEQAIKLFKLLQISITDVHGKVKPTNDLFLETIDRLGRVANTAQRSAGQAAAFGEAYGPKMGQMVDAGTAAIEELRKAVHDTGMVLGEDQIQKADETAKKLKQVSAVLSAKIATTVVENANAISTLADALAQVAAISVKAAANFAMFLAEANKGVPQLGGQSKFGTLFGMITNPAATIAKMGLGLGQQSIPGQSTASVTVDLAPAKGKPKPKPGPNIDLSTLLAPKPPKGRKGKQAPDDIFERETAQAEEQRLRLLQDATADLQKKNEIEHLLLDMKLKEREHAIDLDVKHKRLTAAEAKTLKAAEEANTQAQKEAADRKTRSDLIEQQAQRAQQLLDAEDQMYQVALQLARTDEERTKIEAAILASKQEQERLEIDKQIALARETPDQQKIADLVELRRRMLERQGAEKEAFAVSRLRGIDEFKNKLPKTVAEIYEAIENIRFEQFQKRLQDMANFARGVGDAFGNAAVAIVNFQKPLDILRGFLSDLANTLNEQLRSSVSDWATDKIGVPFAKKALGKSVTGPDELTVQQMNVALGMATSSLSALQVAASSAAFAMGSAGGTGGTAAAADSLSTSINLTGKEFSDVNPQVQQFGSGLMSVLASLSGGGGGGGWMSYVKMGLGIASAAFGGGGAAAGGGDFLASTLPGAMSFGGGFSLTGHADGGWSRGPGGPRGDKLLHMTSDGEFTTNAQAAAVFAPILEGINSGRIPNVEALRGLLGGVGQNVTHHKTEVNVGGVHIHGAKDDRSARRAGRQASSEIQRELGLMVRAGYSRK